MEDRIVNVNVTFYTYLYSVFINKAGRVSAKSNNSRSAVNRVIYRVSNLRFILSVLMLNFQKLYHFAFS